MHVVLELPLMRLKVSDMYFHVLFSDLQISMAYMEPMEPDQTKPLIYPP